MNAFDFLINKQLLWAIRNNKNLQGKYKDRGERAYTSKFEDNFFWPISEKTIEELKKGDGGEIKKGPNPSRIQAVYSSSALAVNLFDHWRLDSGIDPIPIAKSVKISSRDIKYLEFEKKLPIMEPIDQDVFPRDPNIDVFITYKGDEQKAVGIECKFTEPYSSFDHNKLSESYLLQESLWPDLPKIGSLAEKICSENKNNVIKDKKEYKYLHTAQLIKHILGLKHFSIGKEKFRLVYLWYDVPFDEGYHHRLEIDKFADVAAEDGINFQAITYQEVIISLAKAEKDNHSNYINYITSRYL